MLQFTQHLAEAFDTRCGIDATNKHTSTQTLKFLQVGPESFGIPIKFPDKLHGNRHPILVIQIVQPLKQTVDPRRVGFALKVVIENNLQGISVWQYEFVHQSFAVGRRRNHIIGELIEHRAAILFLSHDHPDVGKQVVKVLAPKPVLNIFP